MRNLKNQWKKLVVGLSLLFAVGMGITQAQTHRYLEDSTCRPAAKPFLLLRGEQVTIGCDTAWLINSFRYQLYEKSRQFIMQQKSSSVEKTLDEYETALQESDRYAKSMGSKYREVSDEFQRYIADQKGTLERMQADMVKAREEVSLAQKELDEVAKRMQRSARKNRNEKWLIGLGSLSAGILTGILIKGNH